MIVRLARAYSFARLLVKLYLFTVNVSLPVFTFRNAKDENLIANRFACMRLERMNAAFAQGILEKVISIIQGPNSIELSAAADALNPTLATLDKKLSKFTDGNPVRIDGRPRASGILDTVGCLTTSSLVEADRLHLDQGCKGPWLPVRLLINSQ